MCAWGAAGAGCTGGQCGSLCSMCLVGSQRICSTEGPGYPPGQDMGDLTSHACCEVHRTCVSPAPGSCWAPTFNSSACRPACRGPYLRRKEKKICHKKKRYVTRRGAGGQNTAKAMFGKDELAAILKFGAEELFREDERAKVEKQHELLAEDLDAILARAEVLPCAWPCVVIVAALCRTGPPGPAGHSTPRRPRCWPALPTRQQRRACGTGRCQVTSAPRYRPASATLAARCPSHVLLPPCSPCIPMHSTDSVSAHHGRTIWSNGAMQHGGKLGGPTGLNFDPRNQFQVLAPSGQPRIERELAEGTRTHPLRSWPE